MSTQSIQKTRKPFAMALLVVIVWFGITGVMGPLFGKLSSVQENNNSSFLPKGAEATKAADVIATFSDEKTFNFPTLILFEGTSTPETFAAINAHISKVGALTLDGTSAKISDFLAPGSQISVFPSQDGKAILANIPLDGNSLSKVLPNDKPVLPALIAALREDIKPIAQASGLEPYVTGPGGLLGDLFSAFGTLDSTLLLTTLGVVAIILIFVYRSPILWFLPLLSAVFALSTAGGIIYLLAKNDVIDVNGQSQGILSVLVLGAGTDYALLLISRYREELHHHSTPVAAMRAAYKGTFEPIVASGATVALGLLVLLLSDLSGNRGLGPIGAIGVAVAVITMVTLLPAFLVLFGRWIFWPRIPRFDDVDAQLTGTWAKVGNLVERRPRRAWVITGLLLVVLAGFSTTLKTDGLSTSESFTGNPESVVGQKLLLNHFPGGEGDPTKVILKNELIPAVSEKLRGVAGVTAVAPEANAAGVIVKDGLSILNVTLSTAPDSRESRDRIPAIREAVKSVDESILVGGTTAVFFDTDVAARHDNRTVIPVVLLLITLILGLLLRSIVSALLLLGTVVLSYFATLGVWCIDREQFAFAVIVF